jgi:hypothetical protein
MLVLRLSGGHYTTAPPVDRGAAPEDIVAVTDDGDATCGW